MNDNEKLIEEAAKVIEKVPYHAWCDVTREGSREIARAALAVFEKAHTPAPPVYLAADLWQALGAPISDFDAYYERNGWADTWANVLGAVRDHFRPKCGQDTDGERCVLTAGHLPPHYGPSDVGSSEPVPVAEGQGEPSAAQVEAALIAHLGYDPAPAGFPFKGGEKDQMRAALRAAGGVR